jgi:hypothetical protein
MLQRGDERLTHRPLSAYCMDDDTLLMVCRKCSEPWPCPEADVRDRSYRITTAPPKYDGFDTETVEWLPYREKNGARYRRVSIISERVGWQLTRYASGGYSTIIDVGFAEWERLGLLHHADLTPPQLEYNRMKAQEVQEHDRADTSAAG